MLIVGPLAAAASFLWLALGHDAALAPGVLAPLGLLGLAFAILVAPLTSAVLSSVTDADEGLASGINNAMSRIAQLAGIALAAGLASCSWGFAASMIGAAALAAAGAGVIAATVRRRAGKGKPQ
jgi:hypothetical protein